jgi:SAM-dependent methyltransferase
MTPRLTAVEVDAALAEALATRMSGTNVEVVHADATHMPFPDDRFSAAVSFMMLHHVPTTELQDVLLAEVARVLRPGATFAGVDGIDTPEFRELVLQIARTREVHRPESSQGSGAAWRVSSADGLVGHEAQGSTTPSEGRHAPIDRVRRAGTP